MSFPGREFREDIDDVSPTGSVGVLPTAADLDSGDAGWIALGPAIAFSILATIIVALRWYSRGRLLRCVGLDDYVILLSVFLSWAMLGLISTAVSSGVGSYTHQINTTRIAKLIVANNGLWSLCVNITKSSILTQYLRIFQANIKTRFCCYVLLICLLPAACWGIFSGIFLCRPTAKLWNPQIPGSCRSTQTYWTSVAAVDISLDFLILILPLPCVSALRLPRTQRVATLLLFLLGFGVCVVSVAHLAAVVLTAEEGDIILSGLLSITFSVVEANVGIACASLLALRPLLVEVFPRISEAGGNGEIPEHHTRIAEVEEKGHDEVPIMAGGGGKVPVSLPSTSGTTVGSSTGDGDGDGGGGGSRPSSGMKKEEGLHAANDSLDLARVLGRDPTRELRKEATLV